jgi:hypothetical protein
VYIGNSLRYEKDMESRQHRAEYDAWLRQKKYVLGPSLSCPLYSKNSPIVLLQIPMVMYHTEIWRFWRNRKFRWDGELFNITIPGSGNAQKWLDRAVFLFNRMWDNVNEGKMWNENLGT